MSKKLKTTTTVSPIVIASGRVILLDVSPIGAAPVTDAWAHADSLTRETAAVVAGHLLTGYSVTRNSNGAVVRIDFAADWTPEDAATLAADFARGEP